MPSPYTIALHLLIPCGQMHLRHGYIHLERMVLDGVSRISREDLTTLPITTTHFFFLPKMWTGTNLGVSCKESQFFWFRQQWSLCSEDRILQHQTYETIFHISSVVRQRLETQMLPVQESQSRRGNFGRLISKHSDKGLPPPLCLPVRRLVIAQHYAFPRKPSPRHVFFQVLVSLRNSHIQIHDVILKFTSEWVQITYYLLHGAHCATNVGAIFTPNSVCLFLLLWQELYFNKLCENIYLQIW